MLQVRGVDDEAEEIDRREEEKKVNIATSRQKIAQLEAESSSMESDMEAVGPEQMQLAKRQVEVANRAVQEKVRDRDRKLYTLEEDKSRNIVSKAKSDFQLKKIRQTSK